MRVAAVFSVLLGLMATAAYAEPITYQCSQTGSETLVLQDNAVLPAQYGGQAQSPLVIDWQADRMRFGTGTDMPMIANEQGVVGILRTITPAQDGNPEQQVFVTYRLIRTTGQLSTNAHIVMSDTLFSIRIGYQCRTESGATAF